jgi:hypothetical protein
MKSLPALLLFLLVSCVSTAFFGCQRHSVNTMPSDTFRLLVDDMVKDEAFRVVSLRISSMRPGILSVDREDSHARGYLLLSDADKLWSGQALFLASRMVGPSQTNALIQVRLQVKVEGGDGGMLLHGSFQSGGSGPVYAVTANTQLDGFLSVTATNGIYPLQTPLEIGRINGKPVTLTITN